MDYNTQIIKVDYTSDIYTQIKPAIDSLKSSNIIGIPTETVYGLAANALDEVAVQKIFKAKGRPQDNPLIVHISDLSELESLATDIPDIAYRIADKFWAGPLTMVLKKSNLIPNIISGGLDSVAVRLPEHKLARKLIRLCGFPIAAPSANISGSPSPTTAQHVFDDLNGKIPFIIDGGNCSIGLESTVISLLENVPRLLRPGGISIEELKECIGHINIDKSVLEDIASTTPTASPGMKYKHYSPNTELFLFSGTSEEYISYISNKNNIGALCFDEEKDKLNVPYISYGSIYDLSEQAKLLFSSLRKVDKLNVDKVIVHAPDTSNIGLSVYNRLLRSAGFKIINTSDLKG